MGFVADLQADLQCTTPLFLLFLPINHCFGGLPAFTLVNLGLFGQLLTKAVSLPNPRGPTAQRQSRQQR
ncbi:hypothetical protein D3C80_2002950 [compost metagenome]